MDYVDSKTGKRHAGMRHSPGKGLTTCGRVIPITASGACIAPMIECERCRNVMRRNGWTV